MRSDKHFAKRTRLIQIPKELLHGHRASVTLPSRAEGTLSGRYGKTYWIAALLSFPGVENGHTVPAFETLEKPARALEMPLYQLMFDGDKPPALTLKGLDRGVYVLNAGQRMLSGSGELGRSFRLPELTGTWAGLSLSLPGSPAPQGEDIIPVHEHETMKHRIVHFLQKYLFNPPIMFLFAIGLVPPGYGLL